MAILEGYNLERTEDEEEIEYADLHFNRFLLLSTIGWWIFQSAGDMDDLEVFVYDSGSSCIIAKLTKPS